jgi:uncharacterized protein YukE
MPNPQESHSTAPLEELASAMSSPKKGTGGFESTYAKIMKGLTKTLYNVPESKISDPQFISEVLLDAKAARLKSKVKNGIDTQAMAQTSGDINATLMKMQTAKATAAYHGKYAQDFAPMQADANQQTLEHDKLLEEIGEFIGKLHTTFKNPDVKPDTMSALEKEERGLETRAERLGININALLDKLVRFHHETFVLLPTGERSGLKAPPTITETPAPE